MSKRTPDKSDAKARRRRMVEDARSGRFTAAELAERHEMNVGTVRAVLNILEITPRRMERRSRIDDEKLREMWPRFTTAQIASDLEVSVVTVRNAGRRLGLPAKPRGKLSAITPEDAAAICGDARPIEQLAECYGCSESLIATIRQWWRAGYQAGLAESRPTRSSRRAAAS